MAKLVSAVGSNVTHAPIQETSTMRSKFHFGSSSLGSNASAAQVAAAPPTLPAAQVVAAGPTVKHNFDSADQDFESEPEDLQAPVVTVTNAVVHGPVLRRRRPHGGRVKI